MLQVAEQDYEKEKLNERIAKLSGGVAIIQVTFILVAFDTILVICRFLNLILFIGWSTNRDRT